MKMEQTMIDLKTECLVEQWTIIKEMKMLEEKRVIAEQQGDIDQEMVEAFNLEEKENELNNLQSLW